MQYSFVPSNTAQQECSNQFIHPSTRSNIMYKVAKHKDISNDIKVLQQTITALDAMVVLKTHIYIFELKY